MLGMEAALEVIYDRVGAEAAKLLATGDWNPTTSNGTCDQFLTFLMENTAAGKRFDRFYDGRGRSAFLEWVRRGEGGAAPIFSLMKNRSLLQQNGVPLNLADRFAEMKRPLIPIMAPAAHRARMLRH